MRSPEIGQYIQIMRDAVHTLFGGKVTILRANILELLCSWIHDLDVTREVFVAIHFGEVVECLIGNFSHIKLVIPDGQQIVVDILKNRVRNVAVGCGRITQASPIMQVLRMSALIHIHGCMIRIIMLAYPSIDQKQIYTKSFCFLFHVLRKAHIVSPVGSIVLLLDVTF